MRRFSEQDVLRLAQTAYSENPSFDIVPERTALLVIDMQDEFVKPHWTPFWVPQATRIVKPVRRLVNYCRHENIPVVFTAYARTHFHLDRPKTGAFMPNRYTGKVKDDPSYLKTARSGTSFPPVTRRL